MMCLGPGIADVGAFVQCCSYLRFIARLPYLFPPLMVSALLRCENVLDFTQAALRLTSAMLRSCCSSRGGIVLQES